MSSKAFGQRHETYSMINEVAAASLIFTYRIPSQSMSEATAGLRQAYGRLTAGQAYMTGGLAPD